jgi:hypothetical protein
MQLLPLRFDATDCPQWGFALPTAPQQSALGHALPYLHPGIGITRPPRWRHSRRLYVAWAFGFALPVILLSIGLLALLNCWAGMRMQGIRGRLQRLEYRLMTAYQDDWSHNPVQAALMFPGEACPLPVDVGMVEPVMVLYAMGIPTTYCCEGHEGMGVAYLGIAAPNAFPASLLEALDQAGVPYNLERFDDDRVALYDRGNDFRFSAVLRAWARERAAALLAASP